jgi:hypothetical protein
MNFNINKYSEFVGVCVTKVFTVISINKYPFKGLSFTILLLIGIITSIIIRLDYVFNLLNQLPYELMVSLRLTSGLYSILLIFLFIINIKHCFELIKLYYNNYILINNKLDNSILILYMLYFSYILLVTIIVSIINYYSIISLNIIYLDIIYLCSLIISILIGIYYSIYKVNIDIDLSKTLSFTGKVCFISFIIFYLCLFIGLRTGCGANILY